MLLRSCDEDDDHDDGQLCPAVDQRLRGACVQQQERRSGRLEVEFSRHFQELTAEVISRTAFGSSYKEGKEVFHTQQQLMALAMATLLNLQLPGFKQVILLLFFYSPVTVLFLQIDMLMVC